MSTNERDVRKRLGQPDPVRPAIAKRLEALGASDTPEAVEPPATPAQKPRAPAPAAGSDEIISDHGGQAAGLRPQIMERLNAIEEPNLLERGEVVIGRAGAGLVRSLRGEGPSSGQAIFDQRKVAELAGDRIEGPTASRERRPVAPDVARATDTQQPAPETRSPATAPPADDVASRNDRATERPRRTIADIPNMAAAAGPIQPDNAIERRAPAALAEQARRAAEQREAREYARKLPTSVKVKNAAGAFVGGLAEVPAGLLDGIAVLSKELDAASIDTYGDKPASELVTAQWAAKVREVAREAFPQDEKLQQDFIWSVLPAAFGSFGGYIAASGLAGLAGGAAGATSTAVATATGGGISTSYREAVEAGASEDDAREAGMMGSVPGAIQVLPVLRVLERFRKAGAAAQAGGRASTIGQGIVMGAIEEGPIEGVGQLGHNIIARWLSGYDPDRPLFQGVAQATLAGGIAGAGVGGVVTGVGTLRRPGEPELESAPEARDPAVTEAFQQALGQGMTPEDVIEQQAQYVTELATAAESGVTPDGVEIPPDQVVAMRQQVAQEIAALTQLMDETAAHFGSEQEAKPPKKAGFRRRIADAIDPSRTREVEQLAEERDAERRKVEVDPLTGLGSRQALTRAQKAVDEDPRWEWVAIDADNLKAVNDVEGHAAGDEFLKQIGGAIAEVSPRGFHPSGDEFMIAVPKGTAEQAAQAVAEAVGARELEVGGRKVTAGVSFGTGATLEEADAALVARKQARAEAGESYRSPPRQDAAPEAAADPEPDSERDRIIKHATIRMPDGTIEPGHSHGEIADRLGLEITDDGEVVGMPGLTAEDLGFATEDEPFVTARRAAELTGRKNLPVSEDMPHLAEAELPAPKAAAPAEPEAPKVTFTKAKIVPTREGVKAVPIEEPAPVTSIVGDEPTILRNPAGTFSFVGSVPKELAFTRADGSPISDEEFRTIQQHGRPGTMKQKFPARTWPTQEAAEQALAEWRQSREPAASPEAAAAEEAPARPRLRVAFKVDDTIVHPQPGDVLHSDILDRPGSLGPGFDADGNALNRKIVPGFVDERGNFLDRKAAREYADRFGLRKPGAVETVNPGSGELGADELAAPEPVAGEIDTAQEAAEPATTDDVASEAAPMELPNGGRAYKQAGTWHVWSKKEDRYVAFPNDPEHAGFALYQAMERQAAEREGPVVLPVSRIVSPAIARQEGKDAFHAGAPRVPPADMTTNPERKAWLAGWDTENINAPVPELESEQATSEPAAGEASSTAKLDAIADAARARLEARRRGGPRLQAGLDPIDLYDYALIGAVKITKGAFKSAQFTTEMVREFGEEIRPFLARIRDLAMKIINGEHVAFAGVGTEHASQLKAAAAEIAAINSVMTEYADLLGGETVATGTEDADVGAQAEEEGNAAAAVEDAGAGVPRVEGSGATEGAESEQRPRRTPRGGRKSGKRRVRPDRAADQVGESGAAGGVGAAGRRGDSDKGRAAVTDTPAADAKKVRGEDYRITPGELDDLGGPKARARQNLAAIRIIKQLDEENRPATREEQAQLVRYVGWGGLADMFGNPYTGFKPEWKELGEELKALLTEEEYRTASRSTQYAHYTSPEVISVMFDALKRFGVKGRVRALEPGAGVGHFIGQSQIDARWTAVEMDGISAKIIAALYPSANVLAQPYQKTVIPDESFDVAIGNPPFGDIPISDPRYTARHNIHDYFFVRSLDKLRPGGVLAFVTSTGTMDKTSRVSRNAIAERADLIGAVRLPGTAFQKNAATEVTTDILFFRKRDKGQQRAGEKWMALAEVRGWKINEYFAAHPDHVLGELVADKLHPNRPGVRARASDDLRAEIERVVATFPDNLYSKRPTPNLERTGEQIIEAEVPADAKEGQYLIAGKRIGQVRNGQIVELRLNGRTFERVRHLIRLGEAARKVLAVTADGGSDDDLAAAQKAMTTLYDAFVKTYGPINMKRVASNGAESRPNLMRYNDPVNGPLVQGLEDYNEKTGEARKTALHTKRLYGYKAVLENVDSAWRAVIASLVKFGRPDMDEMVRLYGKSEQEIIDELGDAIFRNPLTGLWETRETYLTGNVREKLAIARSAAADDAQFARNVTALEGAQPQDLTAAQIVAQRGATLGVTWINEDTYKEFARNVVGMDVAIEYSPIDGKFSVRKGQRLNEAKYLQWGTSDIEALDLLADAMNGRRTQVEIPDPNNPKGKIVDAEASAAAEAKKRELQDRFLAWALSEDADRTEMLVRRYNDVMNNTVLAEWDGSHLRDNMPGLATHFRGGKLELADHQLNVIWRFLANGNTLVAHEVGAGKTIAMVAMGMEARRLGIARKPMYVVPNHMLGQFSREFLEVYPSAHILVADDYQFHTSRRREFVARAATDDWDAIIMTHSSFQKIPVSPDFEEGVLDRMLAEFQEMLEAGVDNQFTRKKIENAIEKFEERLDGLRDKTKARQDRVIYFDEMGVDMLVLDEAHEFKNLELPSSTEGISMTGANKTQDMYIKTRVIEQINPGRGLVFATATPVSNAISEMYVMQRYLMEAELERRGYRTFNAWANDFVESYEKLEFTATGAVAPQFRPRHYKSAFSMAQLFRAIADIKTAEDLALPTPKLIGDGPEVVEIPPDPRLQTFMRQIKHRWQTKPKRPEKGEDNVLSIMNDARYAAMDARFVTSPHARRGGHDASRGWSSSKAQHAAQRIFEIWKETADVKGTQLVFSDLAVPKDFRKVDKAAAAELAQELGEEPEAEFDPASEADGYDIYNDVKDRLVAMGVPASEVAFVQETGGDKKKRQALFDRVKTGEVRVLIGSTPMMGQGTNVQDRLVALHHLDVPWKPAWIDQRDGRIIRRGNKLWENVDENGNHKPLIEGVRVLRYLLVGSFDSRAWQILANKLKFIHQGMTARADVGLVDALDASSGMTPDEAAEVIMALASDNPYAMPYVEAQGEVQALERQEREHKDKDYQYRLRARNFRTQSVELQRQLEAAKDDNETLVDATGDAFRATIDGTEYTDRAKAGEALLDALKRVHSEAPPNSSETQIETIGTFAGLKLRVHGNKFATKRPYISLYGKAGYYAYPNVDGGNADGVGQTLENMVARVRNALDSTAEKIAEAEKNADETEALIGQPFPLTAKLEDARARLADLNVKMKGVDAAQQAKLEAEQAERAARDEGRDDDAGGIAFHTFGITALAAGARTAAPGLAPAVESTARGVKGIARFGYDTMNEDLIHVVRKQGAGGEWFARRAEGALNHTKKVIGTLALRQNRALRQVALGLDAQRAVSWLQRVKWNGDAGFARIQTALESERIDPSMPDNALHWLRDQRQLQWRMGKMGEKAKVYGRREPGLLQRMPDGSVRRFRATKGGRIALRMATQYLTDMYMNPRGPAWDTYVAELARLNGLEPKEVRRILEPMTGKRFRTTHAEIPRLLKVHPTHIRVRTRSGWARTIPVLETHPYRYTAASVRGFAHRLGFVRQFGQSLFQHDPKEGKFDQLEVLRDKAIQKGVDGTDADNLLRTLSGIPLEGSLFKPGTPEYEIADAAGHLMGAVRSGMLSAAWVPNLPEFMGNITTFGGVERALRGLLQLSPTRWRETAVQLERMGLASADVANMTIDHNRWLESWTRVFGEAVLRVFPTKPAWAWQEKHAAAVGLLLARDLQAKKGGEFERVTLKVLDFPAKQIDKLMSGEGTRDDYLEVARRFAARTNTTRLTLASEHSRWGNSRIAKTFLWFTAYPMMKARTFGRIARTLHEATVAVQRNPSTANLRQLGAATTKFAQYHAGTAASGAVAYSILAFLMGGAAGFDAVEREWEEDPLAFIARSWAWAHLGPIITSIGRVWADNRIDNWWLVSAPAGVMYETIQAFAGLGKYQTMTPLERARAWGDRHMPGPRRLNSLMTAYGLTEKNGQLAVATREYWRWRRRHVGSPGRFEPGDTEEGHIEFRKKMRQAYELMIREDAPVREHEIRELLNEAIGVEDKSFESAASSIRARRLLTRLSPEERAAFKEYSPEAYRQIEMHDDLLDRWASGRRRRRKPTRERTRRRRDQSF